MKKIAVSVCLAVLAISPSCKTGMKARQDPVSGQIIIVEGNKPVLQYNYKTVFEKDAVDTMPANKYKREASDTFHG